MAKNAPTPKVITKKHLARLERENLQRRNLLIGYITVGILVLGVIVYGILDQSVLLYLRPVAKVGSQSITLGDFQKRVKFTRYQMIQQFDQYLQLMQMFGGGANLGGQFTQQLQQMQNNLGPANANQIGSDTLNTMIDDIDIANEALKRNITVSDDEVNKSMQSSFNYFPNGSPTPTVTPTTGATSTLSALQMTLVPPTATETQTLTPAATETPLPPTPTSTPTVAPTGATPTITQTPTITPTATPYTFQGYQTQVSNYADQLKSTGFTEADIRSMVKAQLLRQKVEDAVTSNVKPQQEQVWARDILVPDETTAVAVRGRLANGEDFAKVAKQVSTDTTTKDQGGDLGWFPAGQKDPAIDKAAFSLKIGEISQPIKAADGYHIIQVLGHEVRPLSATDFQSLRNQAFQKWLNTARAAKTVQKFDFYLQYIPTEPTLSPNEQLPAQ